MCVPYAYHNAQLYNIRRAYVKLSVVRLFIKLFLKKMGQRFCPAIEIQIYREAQIVVACIKGCSDFLQLIHYI